MIVPEQSSVGWNSAGVKCSLRERLDGSSVWHTARKVSQGRLPYCCEVSSLASSRRPCDGQQWLLAETNLERTLQSPLFLPAFIQTSFSGAFKAASQLLLRNFSYNNKRGNSFCSSLLWIVFHSTLLDTWFLFVIPMELILCVVFIFPTA